MLKEVISGSVSDWEPVFSRVRKLNMRKQCALVARKP